MFTQQDRQNVIDKICNHFSSLKSVKAIALVGSIAQGKSDQYSDVDISIVIEDNEVENVWKESEIFFLETFDSFKHFMTTFNEKSFLIGLCLKNSLEIDIGFNDQENFEKNSQKSSHLRTRIIYAREDFEFEQKIIVPITDVTNLLEERVNDLWYDYLNVIIALKRNQLFRALNGVESIRNQIVEIYAKSKGLEHKHFRHVDKFDDLFKNKLACTCTELSYQGLKNALINLLNLFCDLLRDFNLAQEAENYLQHFNDLMVKIDL